MRETGSTSGDEARAALLMEHGRAMAEIMDDLSSQNALHLENALDLVDLVIEDLQEGD